MAISGYKVKPNYATVPGDTLREVINDRQMTQKELASRLDLTPKHVSNIINGEVQLTPETAKKLEFVFNVDASFWNSLEKNYQEYKQNKVAEAKLKKQEELLKSFPVKELERKKFIEKGTSASERVNNLLKFFGFVSFDALKAYTVNDNNFAGAYRLAVSNGQVVDNNALISWIRKGDIEAAKINTGAFSKEIAESSINDLRSLTKVIDPQIFIPQLQKLCASFGVAVVFVPEIKGSKVCGMTRWMSVPQKAIIQLSLRYKTNDVLWFTFFHELGHILKHKKEPFVTTPTYVSSKIEEEANDFAANILIPPIEYSAFIQEGDFSNSSVQNFAKKIDIHPGIVVGRLQKERYIEYYQLTDLKTRYEWNI
ncbi:helix-turn-helix domain-containing protein [Listeria seeligeri]|uniref:helix-turn-helix domain-containing protein n=1 Tax=Listeria seeligeri TaxID=1640 RepID=UPI00162406BC|nr:helix-turn-helix domain-containing protein [Listeria seeligeri]MBC1724504.1 helix-turn-helix domain-containing protein [Listeria seeligeri]MBF2437212.1 helix-turn-helix domain-containing protein [Listeria seeligeri]